MPRIAFTMKLHKGFEEEYRKRHTEISNDVTRLLKRYGIAHYSIFLDEETNVLYANLSIEDIKHLDKLSAEPVMQNWWAFMKDIMETNADGSPVTLRLQEVFYLE